MSVKERLSTVTWQRSDRLYLEMGRLDRTGENCLLSGTVLYRGRSGPTAAEYRIETAADGRTTSAFVRVDEPAGEQVLDLESSPDGSWTRDGKPLDLDFPCQDVDIAITPATNTLAIRRLRLAVGDSAPARVLWIQVPSFKMRAVEQHYDRIDKETYRYKGRYGSYQISVDANGMVLNYPGGGWSAAAHKLSAKYA